MMCVSPITVRATQVVAGCNPFEIVKDTGYVYDTYYKHYPNDSDAIKKYYINDLKDVIITGDKEVNGYVEVILDNERCWIKADTIYDSVPFIEYDIYESGRKSYMDWECITDTTSRQYALQAQAYTGWNGIRMVGDRYCIAVGSYFTTEIGTKIDLVIQHDNGNTEVVKCILGDCKADIHTDANNMYAQDGSLAEFIVNTSSLPSIARQWGSVTYASNDLSGKIIKLRVYK